MGQQSVLTDPKRMYALFRFATNVGFILMAVLTFSLGRDINVDWRSCAVYMLLATACEVLSIRMQGLSSLTGEMTLGFVVIWGGAILWGPVASISIAVFSMVMATAIGWSSTRAYIRLFGDQVETTSKLSRRQRLLRMCLYKLANVWLDRKEYPLKWLFQCALSNVSLAGILAASAGLVYLFAGGLLLQETGGVIVFWYTVVPFIAGVSTYLLVDTISYGVMCAIWEPSNLQKKKPGDFAVQCWMWASRYVRPNFPSYLLFGPVALILAYLQINVGCISLLAVILPFYAMRYAYTLTMDQVTMYRDTITTLGTYMQHYHPYTRGHLRRVADLSERLARELKLPADVIILMSDAGMLHDIGKVGVSEEILDKVSRLTDEEWEQIKSHPVKGAEIVSHLDFLDRIVGWVKYHHKWYNGSGYPDDGLKELPIEAAIIAVADAFDAMTDDRELSLEWSCDSCGYVPGDSSRPEVCPVCGAEKRRRYRQPLSLERAIDELRRGAGSQFHPEVVKAFLRLILDDQNARIPQFKEQMAA